MKIHPVSCIFLFYQTLNKKTWRRLEKYAFIEQALKNPIPITYKELKVVLWNPLSEVNTYKIIKNRYKLKIGMVI